MLAVGCWMFLLGQSMNLSVIICTHNHLASLRETMAGFVERVKLPNMACRPLHEPQKGQVRARNYQKFGLVKLQR